MDNGGLRSFLCKMAKKTRLPSGREALLLGLRDMTALSLKTGVSLRLLEIKALGMDLIPEHYVRNMDSLSIKDQIRLLESKIGMVGLGGLGGNILEILARTGVGKIAAADGDVFEESNLNRQLLGTTSELGASKAKTAIERCLEINPAVDIEACADFLDNQGMDKLLLGANLAIDALGGLDSRLELQKAAARANVPLVTGAMAGWTGYIGVVAPGGPGPAELMGQGSADEDTQGCPSATVTTVAALMCAQAVKILLGMPVKTGSLTLIDLRDMTFEQVSL